MKIVIQGMTWENIFVGLFLLFVGMFARGLWWRIKRALTQGIDWG